MRYRDVVISALKGEGDTDIDMDALLCDMHQPLALSVKVADEVEGVFYILVGFIAPGLGIIFDTETKSVSLEPDSDETGLINKACQIVGCGVMGVRGFIRFPDNLASEGRCVWLNGKLAEFTRECLKGGVNESSGGGDSVAQAAERQGELE